MGDIGSTAGQAGLGLPGLPRKAWNRECRDREACARAAGDAFGPRSGVRSGQGSVTSQEVAICRSGRANHEGRSKEPPSPSFPVVTSSDSGSSQSGGRKYRTSHTNGTADTYTPHTHTRPECGVLVRSRLFLTGKKPGHFLGFPRLRLCSCAAARDDHTPPPSTASCARTTRPSSPQSGVGRLGEKEMKKRGCSAGAVNLCDAIRTPTRATHGTKQRRGSGLRKPPANPALLA